MADGAVSTVWPVLHYDDPEAARHFLVDVVGFREAVVVRDDGGEIVHAELRWPGGGAVLFGGTRHTDSVHGGLKAGAVYLATDDVDAVHDRAVRVGADVVRAPHTTEFAAGGPTYAFSVRDPEGNLWTVGTYCGTSDPAPIAAPRRVLVLGFDPRAVPGFDPEPVVAALARGEQRLRERGITYRMGLVPLDETVEDRIVELLALEPYECVIVGGGIRKEEALLELLETVIRLARRPVGRAWAVGVAGPGWGTPGPGGQAPEHVCSRGVRAHALRYGAIPFASSTVMFGPGRRGPCPGSPGPDRPVLPPAKPGWLTHSVLDRLPRRNSHLRSGGPQWSSLVSAVGVAGFEPTAPRSQTRREQVQHV